MRKSLFLSLTINLALAVMVSNSKAIIPPFRYTSECTVSDCLECSITDTTKCTTCDNGFYLDYNNQTCESCSSAMNGCLTCSSASICNECENGKEPMNIYTNPCNYDECSSHEYYDNFYRQCRPCTVFGKRCMSCIKDGCLYYDYYYDIWEDWVVYTCIAAVTILIITILVACRRRGVIQTRRVGTNPHSYPVQHAYYPPMPPQGHQYQPQLNHPTSFQGGLPNQSHQYVHAHQHLSYGNVQADNNINRLGNHQATALTTNNVQPNINALPDNQATTHLQVDTGNTDSNINTPMINYPNFASNS